jgi:hypothetical protein
MATLCITLKMHRLIFLDITGWRNFLNPVIQASQCYLSCYSIAKGGNLVAYRLAVS